MRSERHQHFAFERRKSLPGYADDVDFAPVTTLHAFGARLLCEHAIVAGVDPAFALLDETGASSPLAHQVRTLLADAPGLPDPAPSRWSGWWWCSS